MKEGSLKKTPGWSLVDNDTFVYKYASEDTHPVQQYSKRK